MKNYFVNFLDEFEYPDAAKDALLKGYAQIEADAEFLSLVSGFFKDYENGNIDCDKTTDAITVAAEKVGLHKYTAHLIFFICLTKHTKKLYEQKGLSYSLFRDTFKDFGYKLNECYARYKVWGTSCYTAWYTLFFTLERFALGRLQFEIISYPGKEPYTSDGVTINPGDKVLNTHIPSSGPLTPELVEDSFARAAEFFKDVFGGSITPISCHSWLLFPEHYNMLGENSNIVKFMDRYDIVESGTYDNYEYAFITLFDRPFCEDLSTFPADTSIRRGYLKLVEQNKPTGFGLGITLYKS